MKINSLALKFCAPVTLGLILAAGAQNSFAQNTNPTNSFDIETSTASVNRWWGIGAATWDPTLDAANDPASGSLRLEIPYTGTVPEPDGEQFMFHWTIANRWQWDNGFVLDATTYTNLSFDIRVDPSSSPATNGANYGNLQFGLTTRTSWDNRINAREWAIPLSATNWTHVDIPVNPTWNFLNEVVGFYAYMWSGRGHSNNLVLNIDNVMLTKPTAPVVIPPPTLSLQRATPGLNLIASTDVQYERRSIRSVDTGMSFYDSQEPVTYALNIKEGPGNSAPGYQAQIFLAPSEPNDNAASIDWNTPNLVWLHLESNGAGGGQATFRYKTNHPGANAMLFNSNPEATNSSGALIGVGALGTIQSSTISGEWKMTLANTGAATITAPDGTSTNLAIPADAAVLFSGGMRVYYGIQANNDTQYGKGYVFQSVKVSTPTRTILEDNFSGETLDTEKWERRSGDANNAIVVVPTNANWWLRWTLPAVGFTAQVSTNLANTNAWRELSATNQYTVRGQRRTLVKAEEVAPSAAFFRLMKRQFTKLQVLLPGETAAPGTPTGKTGTPTAVQVFTPFDVIVTAVDDQWYPITGVSDTIHLASDDPTATIPADAQLVNGTVTFTGVYFGGEGNFTFTATDVTDATKGAGTSSSIRSNP